jgi:hypothetical protein
MRWFRSNMRFGSWCALLALTVQLVLSFGHVHIAGSIAAAAPAAAAQSMAAAPEAPPVPPKHPGLGDYCAICATVHLAGLPAAEAPSLPLAQLSGRVRIAAWIAAKTVGISGLPFDARAPPLT